MRGLRGGDFLSTLAEIREYWDYDNPESSKDYINKQYEESDRIYKAIDQLLHSDLAFAIFYPDQSIEGLKKQVDIYSRCGEFGETLVYFLLDYKARSKGNLEIVRYCEATLSKMPPNFEIADYDQFERYPEFFKNEKKNTD